MRVSNPPLAASLMTTARSFGNYDLAAALADLIDNSVTARATEVSVSFEPLESDVVVRIRDNGSGMTRDTLITAMRPASKNPDSTRDPQDLGRFGWGLKSASLSQARVLTVVSWRDGEMTAARWNIDDIDDWGMDLFNGEDALRLLRDEPETSSGTEVVWSCTDRLAAEHGNKVDEGLTHSIAQAKDRLELTFHRFLSAESGNRLDITVNGSPLRGIDPFLLSHNATQTLDAESIEVGDAKRITIQPFILPHFSKLTHEEQRTLGGPEGMVRNQGFYVYRNRRLIIHGTWFRLVPHGELSQLTRVRVDLPNSLDADWRITVDKSGAQLPPALRQRLRGVVSRFSRRSVSAHRKKGITLNRRDRVPVWNRIARHGRISYVINRDHPMITRILDGPVEPDEADTLLRLIEQYLPTEGLVSDVGADDNRVAQGGTDPQELERLLRQCMLNYMCTAEDHPSLDGFLEFIRNIEPFASQWTFTESHVRENGATFWGLDHGVR